MRVADARIAAAVAAGALFAAVFAPPAPARAASPVAWEGTVGLATDNVSRGLTATRGQPTATGALDLVAGAFRVGAAAANNDFGDGTDAEVVAHAAITGTRGPLGWQLDAARYVYPGAPAAGDADYWEFGALTNWIAGPVRLDGQAYWSPDYNGGLGHEVYLTGLVTVTLPVDLAKGLSLFAGAGWQWVEDHAALPAIWDWQAGLTLATAAADITLAWTGNDLERRRGNRLTLSVSRSF